MEAFLDGLSAGETMTDYVRNAHTLCLSPLAVEHDSGAIFLTCNGAPMGLPGTKIILHSMSKAIEIAANGQREAMTRAELERSRYACAGDDILKMGNLDVLLKHESMVIMYGLKPSKWGIYRNGGIFCEHVIAMGGTFGAISKRELMDRGEYPAVLDTIRPRLLSVESKGTGEDERNPSFGKGKQLAREVSYLTPGERNAALIAFCFAFRKYGNAEAMLAIPSAYGGWGWKMGDALRDALIPAGFRRVIAKVFSLRGTNEAKTYVNTLYKMCGPYREDRGLPLEKATGPDKLAELEAQGWNDTMLLQLGAVEEREHIAPDSRARWVDRGRAIESRGWVPSFRLKVPLKPYWEREKTKKEGWQSAPYSLRIEQAVRLIGGTDWASGVIYEAYKASLDDLRGPWRYFHKDYKVADMLKYLPVYRDITDASSLRVRAMREFLRMHSDRRLNMLAESFGLSMSFKIPNRDLLFGTH